MMFLGRIVILISILCGLGISAHADSETTGQDVGVTDVEAEDVSLQPSAGKKFNPRDYTPHPGAELTPPDIVCQNLLHNINSNARQGNTKEQQKYVNQYRRRGCGKELEI